MTLDLSGLSFAVNTDAPVKPKTQTVNSDIGWKMDSNEILLDDNKIHFGQDIIDGLELTKGSKVTFLVEGMYLSYTSKDLGITLSSKAWGYYGFFFNSTHATIPDTNKRNVTQAGYISDAALAATLKDRLNEFLIEDNTFKLFITDYFIAATKTTVKIAVLVDPLQLIHRPYVEPQTEMIDD